MNHFWNLNKSITSLSTCHIEFVALDDNFAKSLVLLFLDASPSTMSASIEDMSPDNLGDNMLLMQGPMHGRVRRRTSMQDALDFTKINAELYEKETVCIYSYILPLLTYTKCQHDCCDWHCSN